MKTQKFDLVDNAKLQKLNTQGWFVRQVVEHCRVPFGTSPKYWVLLEKEVTPREELKLKKIHLFR